MLILTWIVKKFMRPQPVENQAAAARFEQYGTLIMVQASFECDLNSKGMQILRMPLEIFKSVFRTDTAWMCSALTKD